MAAVGVRALEPGRVREVEHRGAQRLEAWLHRKHGVLRPAPRATGGPLEPHGGRLGGTAKGIRRSPGAAKACGRSATASSARVTSLPTRRAMAWSF